MTLLSAKNALKCLLSFLLITIIPGGCCQHMPQAAEPSKETIAQAISSRSVGLVHFIDDDGDEVEPLSKGSKEAPFCTGVWINNYSILTAAHCTVHDKPMLADDKWTPVGNTILYTVWNKYSSFYEAVVFKYDEQADLSLLITHDDTNHENSNIDEDPVSIGQQVYMIGQTGGNWWSFSTGYISALRPKDDDTPESIQVEGPVYFGSSGGGVFDANGNVIGIAGFIKRSMPGYGFYYSTGSIRKFLESK